MAAHRQYSGLRRMTAWVGVVGAAVLASAFTIAPAASAQDLEEPDSTTEPTPTTEPTAPTDETPDPEASTDPTANPADQRSVTGQVVEDPNEVADDNVEAQVEPNFGTRKVRVGVQLEDGSFEPGGPTTLGTTIRLSETGPSGDSTSECTTTEEGPEGSSFCDLGPLGTGYVVDPGNTLTVTQLTVNDGLEIIDGTESVGPCEQGQCNAVTLLLTDGLASDDDDDGGDGDGDDSESEDDSDDKSKDGVLPNVGAPDNQLLGYGAALIAGGSLLVAGAKPRPRRKHVLID
jgi:hypothetical protein